MKTFGILPAASTVLLTISFVSAQTWTQTSAPEINWTDVTNPPVLNLTNLQNQVILFPPGSNTFYRLKTQ